MTCALLVAGLLCLTCTIVQAQRSPFLTLQSISSDVLSDRIELGFLDQGTGATNYVVEFTPGFGSAWVEVPGAVIDDLGNGNYQASVTHPGNPEGFYRVRGSGAVLEPVTASFSLTTVQAEEGTSVLATLLFSGPFYGTVRYTVEGTAGQDEFVGLPGEVFVNGTQATIPIHLTDNEDIGELKSLVLRLEMGEGYELGANSQSTVHILENDGDWQGSLIAGDANVGFVLRIQSSNGVHMASVRSDGSGLFPTNAHPASITLTEDYLSALAGDIAMPAEATLLSLPMNLTLHLMAQDGEVDQYVEPTEIKGQAALIVRVPGAPHLNTTNAGAFLLTRTPVAVPSTEVPLISVP